MKEDARSTGGVRTLAGRHRPIPGMRAHSKRERAEAERRAVNSVVQGSAADLLKIAMVEFTTWPKTELDSPGALHVTSLSSGCSGQKRILRGSGEGVLL